MDAEMLVQAAPGAEDRQLLVMMRDSAKRGVDIVAVSCWLKLKSSTRAPDTEIASRCGRMGYCVRDSPEPRNTSVGCASV